MLVSIPCAEMLGAMPLGAPLACMKLAFPVPIDMSPPINALPVVVNAVVMMPPFAFSRPAIVAAPDAVRFEVVSPPAALVIPAIIS